MKSLSRAKGSCWKSNLSVWSYSSKCMTAVVWVYRRAAIFAEVDTTEISGVGTGFNVGMNVVADRVL